MQKLFTVATIVLAALTLGFYLKNPLGTKVIIRGHTIPVEVAVTTEEKGKGLGHRDSLPENTGMLFPYDRKDRYQFWMKGMRFPLDFIWIDGDTVVDLSENVLPPQPGESPRSLQPQVPVDKVLEVNAGSVSKYGISVRDTVKITN